MSVGFAKEEVHRPRDAHQDMTKQTGNHQLRVFGPIAIVVIPRPPFDVAPWDWKLVERCLRGLVVMLDAGLGPVASWSHVCGVLVALCVFWWVCPACAFLLCRAGVAGCC